MSAECFDCKRPYGDEHGFPDLIIPFWAWKQISPTGDGGGLLCPSCICQRLHDAGLRCEGAFMSGPIISVSDPTMNVLSRVENIELAIEGRDNRWAGVREMIADEEETLKQESALPPAEEAGTAEAGAGAKAAAQKICATCGRPIRSTVWTRVVGDKWLTFHQGCLPRTGEKASDARALESA